MDISTLTRMCAFALTVKQRRGGETYTCCLIASFRSAEVAELAEPPRADLPVNELRSIVNYVFEVDRVVYARRAVDKAKTSKTSMSSSHRILHEAGGLCHPYSRVKCLHLRTKKKASKFNYPNIKYVLQQRRGTKKKRVLLSSTAIDRASFSEVVRIGIGRCSFLVSVGNKGPKPAEVTQNTQPSSTLLTLYPTTNTFEQVARWLAGTIHSTIGFRSSAGLRFGQQSTLTAIAFRSQGWIAGGNDILQHRG